MEVQNLCRSAAVLINTSNSKSLSFGLSIILAGPIHRILVRKSEIYSLIIIGLILISLLFNAESSDVARPHTITQVVARGWIG